MTEETDNDGAAEAPQNESDVLTLLKRMQQQLTFLEKKIDSLVNQSQVKSSQERPYQERSSQERPSYRERSYPKPAWSSGRPQRSGHYRGNRDQGEGSSERGYSSGRSYEKRERDDSRGSDGPKKEYGADREPRSDDRSFKKKFGGKKGGFSSGKKPFFSKRKDR
jgi:hypothetical protein